VSNKNFKFKDTIGLQPINEISINKTHLCNAEKTQKRHVKWHLNIFKCSSVGTLMHLNCS